MAETSVTVDSMIKEYLVFRGFSLTLKSFEAELKGDKNKQFKELHFGVKYFQEKYLSCLPLRIFLPPTIFNDIKITCDVNWKYVNIEICLLKIQNIVDQFSSYINTYDVMGMKNYWQYFDKLYFSRLGHDTYKTVKKLEIKLQRLYLIHALQNGRQDKVTEFFEKLATEIQHDEHWKEWFLIPFMKTPEQNKTFAIFYTKLWQDSVMLSLSNCLDTVFTKLPKLLNFEKEQEKFSQLCEENRKLKDQIASYHNELSKLKSQSHAHNEIERPQQSETNEKVESQEDTKGQKKSPLVKPRFGWKLRGNKEKEFKNIAKVNGNSKNDDIPDETRLRYSMDESIFRKFMPVYTAIQTGENVVPSERSLQNSIKDDDTADEPRSTFYTSLEKNSFKKSFSYGGDHFGISSRSTENFLEKPFIILSQDEFKEHNSPIVSTRFSDNGNMVASLDLEGYLKFWECYPTISATSRVSLKDNILCFDWIPNVDNKMLIGKSNSQMTLYDISLKKPLWESHMHSKYKSIISTRCNPSTSSFVCSVAAPLMLNKRSSNHKDNQSQKFIKMKQYPSFNETSSTRQGAVSVWDIHSGQKKSELSLDPFPICVYCLAYNHNGSLVLTGGADGMIRLFDCNNCDCLVGWHAHTSSVLDVMFSADETSIYSLGTDGKLCVWDINKVSSKIAEFILPEGSTGLMYYKIVKELGIHNMDELPYVKLLASDSEGEFMLTCGASGLMIYKVNPKTTLDESMHIVCPSSEVVTLDWTSSPNCSTTVCGTKKGVVQISTLMKGS